MLRSSGVKASRISMNLAARTIDGNVMKFIATDLTDDRYDDFIDFNMKHFVAQEFQHNITGLPKDPEGMAEYKDILSDVLRRPGYRTTVVYRDEDTDRPAIACASTICLMTLRESDDAILRIKPQTKSLQRYFEVARKWDQIFPLREIMLRYGIDQFFDDIGGGVHPDYQRLGISRMILHVSNKMLRSSGAKASKIWMNLAARTTDGNVMKFIPTDLTDDRYEDFIDFNMKHFVAQEFQHNISGLPRDPEGMAEYKEILSDFLRHPKYWNTVVYRDEDTDDRPAIVCASTTCLMTLRESDDAILRIKPQTKSLQRYFEIVRKWDKIYPIHGIMKRYGIDRFFDDIGGSVCPDYQRLGISQMILRMRSQMCKELGVPMTGAWMTSRGTQKAAAKLGWSVGCEITSQQMEQALGLKLPDSSPSIKYMIWGLK